MVVDRQGRIEAGKVIDAVHKSVKARAGCACGHQGRKGGAEPECYIDYLSRGQLFRQRNPHGRAVLDLFKRREPAVNQCPADLRSAAIGRQIWIKPENEFIEAGLLLIGEANTLHSDQGRDFARQETRLDEVMRRPRQARGVLCMCLQQRLTIDSVVGQINCRRGKGRLLRCGWGKRGRRWQSGSGRCRRDGGRWRRSGRRRGRCRCRGRCEDDNFRFIGRRRLFCVAGSHHGCQEDCDAEQGGGEASWSPQASLFEGAYCVAIGG